MTQITKQKDNPLGYEQIPVLLRRFAIPSIVGMVVNSLYNIVDQIFIGQGVGYLGNAATNVAFPLTTICLAIGLLFGIGGAANYSLELGRGNKENAAHTVGSVAYMALGCGIIYALLVKIFLSPMLYAFGTTDMVFPFAKAYAGITSWGIPFLIFTNSITALIRADGSPKYSMTCTIIGAVLNTILDPLFIFVFDMGIAGAAWATVISQFVSFSFALRYLLKFKSVSLKRHHFQFQFRRGIQIASLGLSNSLNQVCMVLVQIVMNNSLTYYGAQSVYGADIPLSSAGIVMKINSIMIGVFVGLSQGSQPILGFNYGARQYDRVKGVYKLAVGYSFIISTLGFIMFQFFPEPLISLFGSADNPLYMEFAVKFMRTYLFMVIINGIQQISSNFFSALGMPMKGVLLSLSRQTFFLIPLLLIFPRFMGVTGTMFAQPVADAAACVLSIYMVRKEFRKMDELASSALS